MIIDGILNTINAILQAALVVFYHDVPDVTIDSETLNAIAAAGNFLHALNGLIPLLHIFLVFASMLVVEALIATYKAIRWGYKKIPGIS